MPREVKCPECGGFRVHRLSDLDDDGKPRRMQEPMWACLDCWHKWAVFSTGSAMIRVPQARV